MSEFAWRAVEPSGRMARGQIEAANAEQAMQRLKAQGLVPLSVDAASGAATAAAPAAHSAAPRAS